MQNQTHAFALLTFLSAAGCTTVIQKEALLQRSKALAAEVATDDRYGSTVFGELPLVASLSRLPWSADSWPSAQGGASFRWQPARRAEEREEAADLAREDETDDLKPYVEYVPGQGVETSLLSPTEKLDIYTGKKTWENTQRERERTLGRGGPRKEISDWEGLMHAWALASLQFEPVHAVKVRGKDGREVAFAPEDIQSLLSLAIHEQSPKPIVLASVCESAMDPMDLAAAGGAYAFENRKQALRRRHCGPIDARTFHLVLTNQIGKKNEGFIVDQDRGGSITNNPVVAYESRILAERPNPTGGRTVRLRTALFLTTETRALDGEDEDSAYPYESETYEYELDLDREGRIASGRWAALDPEPSEINAAIPDFMWRASAVWVNGPLREIYELAREGQPPLQLRPLEDMPSAERSALNSKLNFTHPTSKW